MKILYFWNSNKILKKKLKANLETPKEKQMLYLFE